MANPKFQWNPNSLSYEKVEPTFKRRLFSFIKFSSVVLIFSTITIITFMYFIDSPKERYLRTQRDNIKTNYELLTDRLNTIEKVLSGIQQRDNKIYRVIFEAEPIPQSIREAGFGGTDRYRKLQGYENSELIIETTKKIDKLEKQLKIQSESYDEVYNLAINKAKMLASIPAIQPISNTDLTRLASGYGWRIHPIYKQKKFHDGLDFTAPVGTNIYCTGNGVVKSVIYSNRGYGHHVVVDHGFNYKTLYAHMSEIKVKVGQKVNRGDILGEVGNTGTSTGPHLHYEVIKDDKQIDPINFFYNDLTPEEYEKIIDIASRANQTFD